MRRIISALLICFSSVWALAQEGKSIELAPDAPDRHIVVPGDTLWGIAAQFLKDPYRWPEIWRLNPEDIKNPHRIYPGQVVVLDKSGAQPLLKLGRVIKAEPRVYVEDRKEAIPAIPQHVIEPFLTKPLVVEADALESAPRLVAIQGNRISAGLGDIVYATGVKSKAAQWEIFRTGKPVIDPDKPDETLGTEAMYLGTARLKSEGEPATLEVTSSRQELGRNDYLLPTERSDIISYVPHAPTQQIAGRLISLYGGIGEGGKLSIVSLSRGKKDGLEIGHVLALYHKGGEVSNLAADNKKEAYTLPDERYGLVFVFRVLNRVSYGLVMNTSRPVLEGDIVRTP